MTKLAPDPAKRTLRITITDDLDAIAKRAKKEDLSGRRVRELRAEAFDLPHKVVKEKTTKGFAISEWNKEEHKSLYFLSMLVRVIYSKNKKLRHDHFRNFKFRTIVQNNANSYKNIRIALPNTYILQSARLQNNK